MTTVVVLLLVLLIELYITLFTMGDSIKNMRTYEWLEKCSWLQVKSVKVPIELLLLALLLLVYLGDLAFYSILGEIGRGLYQVCVLYYCLGVPATIDYDSIFIEKHEQTFGVIFWFLILGPMGAALYKLLIVCRAKFNKLSLLHSLAAWLPARITGFIYALVGDFVTGLRCWTECMQITAMHSSKVLASCGRAALGLLVSSGVSGDEAIIQEKKLTERAFIAWIVLSILIVLVIN